MSKRKSSSDKHLRPTRSTLEAEEPDFPRGGGNTLSRDDIHEVRAQAEADFKTETRPTKRQRRTKRDATDDGGFDTLLRSGFTGKFPKYVTMLRYKSLSVGMKIWGIIAEVGSKDIIVSLPGGLRGFVQAEEASDLLVDALKFTPKGINNEGSNSISEAPTAADLVEGVGKSIPFLKEVFSVGQLVVCTVIKLDHTKAKGGGKISKRVGLSLKLGTLHNGLTIDAMHEGLVIWAYVVSVEDHGYLLSFGVPALSGFLLHRDVGDGNKSSRLREGQLLQGVVTSIDKRRGMVMLKANFNLVASSVIKELEGLTLELLVPGMLVNARVRAILKNGLLLSFLTYFTGTVDIFHLENPLPSSNWNVAYSENQNLKARILYVDVVSKAIGLTLSTSLVQNLPAIVDVEVGEIFEDAIVHRVDPTVGLLLDLSSKKSLTAGYVHISNTSDEHIKKLEKKFSKGRKVKARVIGFRWMDGLALLTLKDSELNQLVLSFADVKPGMKVQGEVIVVELFGAFVKLANGLKALCPLQHMSEFQRTKPSAKFQVGAKLKFLVLSCDSQSKKITLTRKKTMLFSKLTPITSYEDAVEGLVTHGWISGIEEYGCFVCFYNGVKGLAHRTELGLEPGAKTESLFHVGQVVKCRVLRSDPLSQRLSLSFIISSDRLFGSSIDDPGQEADISVGAEVSGVITYMTDRTIIFDIPLLRGLIRGMMHTEHLSDNPGHVGQLKFVLHVGYRFDRLLVLEHDGQRLIVSAKFSLLQSAKFLPSNVSQLQPHKVIPGYVASISGAGCFVRFLGGLTGLASIPQVSDDFVHDAAEHFSVGQSVRSQVLEVNEISGRFTLSLKQSVCYSTDASSIQGYFLEEEKIAELEAKDDVSDLDWAKRFMIGTCVEGEIQEIKDYGVIVNLKDHKDVVGFITHYQCNEVEVGRHVQARVLDVVKPDGIIDLTLRPELLHYEKPFWASDGIHGCKENHAELAMHQKVQVVVELVKDEYLVLSLPHHGNVIGFASTCDYNIRMLDSHQFYTPGQRLEATVEEFPESSMVGRLLLLLTKFSNPSAITSSKRVCRKPDKFEPGSLVEGEVVQVQPLQMFLRIGKNICGRINVSEVRDDYAEGNPMNDYALGQKIAAKILCRRRLSKNGRRELFLDLTLRQSVIYGSDVKGKQLYGLPTPASVSVGQIVTGYVKEVTDDWAWLLLSPYVKGRLFVLESSSDPVLLKSFKERFQIGHGLRCKVSKVNYEKGMIDLSLRGLETNKCDTSPNVHEGETDILIKQHDILGGRISKVFPGIGGLSVQIGSNIFGRAHVTHLDDCWHDNPGNDFQEGQFVRCCVLDIKRSAMGNLNVDLSLRPSLGGSGSMNATETGNNLRRSGDTIVDTIEDLKVDMEVQGFVKCVSKKGCFVTLSRHIDARILLSNLSKTYIDDPVKAFPEGKLVKGRILSVEPLSRQVDMTLKSSTSTEMTELGTFRNRLQFHDLCVGDVVYGVIRRIQNFGLFIMIDGSDIVGMCHISEVSDIYMETLEAHFKVGDKVQARVLKKDDSKNHVYLGMKNAYFKDLEEFPSIKDIEEKPGSAELDNDHSASPKFGTGTPSGLETSPPVMISVKDIDGDSAFPSTLGIQKMQLDAPPLDVELDNDGLYGKEEVGDDNLSSKDIFEVPKLTKRARKRVKELREAEIRAAEQKQLEGNQAPENVDDFEKLVHASPNSSFVWIKYMAFMLSLADVEKARSIAERALQTINFREEGEKLNVWIAYLNLENVYGNPPKEALLQLFQRALQYCDPKKMYLALLGIYERTEQHEMADQLFKTMSRKFKTSVKVWLQQIQYMLKRGLSDTAMKLLDRALLSLPHHKHIKTITKAALLEFKLGSFERARAMFEGILRNYPKRTDIWSIYLDQEIRLGDIAVVRGLFERATCLEIAPRKMKFLFKKYLDFENSHGDEEHRNYVKTKAMEYVATKLG